MSTAVHSGIVIPVVSCPTDNVIVFSCSAMAATTLSYDFIVSSSSSSFPSPAARTISYSLNTGCSFNFFASTFALSTLSSSQNVCFNSSRSSSVENGNFVCLVMASRNLSTEDSWLNLPLVTAKNSFRSNAYSSVSPSISMPC